MRSLSLSSAFDLTQGETPRHRPQNLLARNNTFPGTRNVPLSSNSPSGHRGAKGRPAPSRSKRATDVRSALTTTSADCCSTPITELYQAIGRICGGECSPEPTSRGKEHTAVHVDSYVPPSLPSDIPRGMRTRRSSCAPEEGSVLDTIIHETGPNSRQVDSTPTPPPHRGRGVTPLDTPRLATNGGKRVAPPPRRDSQRWKQVKRMPQTRRGDELVFLCRFPATTDTLSQRSQPDPRSSSCATNASVLLPREAGPEGDGKRGLSAGPSSAVAILRWEARAVACALQLTGDGSGAPRRTYIFEPGAPRGDVVLLDICKGVYVYLGESSRCEIWAFDQLWTG